LNNAIKFTEEGIILVSTEKDSRKKEVFVTIKDTGPGIHPDIMPRLFSKFASKSFQDYADWKFLAPSHQGVLNIPPLKKEVGVENSILNCCLKKGILLPKIIGQPVALQILTLIFC
jgi:hypothetical protein